MKTLFIYCLFLAGSIRIASAVDPSVVCSGTEKSGHAEAAAISRFEQAYTEMAAMLDGKNPLSIKRAVFLSEWAYYDEELSYDEYCRTIDSAAIFLKGLILKNKLDQYKTGKNIALIAYFSNPFSGNNHRPFTYDFTNTNDEDDITLQFVTRVMRTHKGQCRSLPMYYKILAEAIGAEAYITCAPAHTFIRYRNEDNLYPEEWVNVEIATRQITPEFWYKEHFEISDLAIRSKVYLHPLTDRETVAAQLSDLSIGYQTKFRRYDEFVLKCAEKSLEYLPYRYNTLIMKGKTIDTMLRSYLDSNGYALNDYVQYLDYQSKKTFADLKSLGWEAMSEELSKKLEEASRQAKIILTTNNQ